MVDLYVYIGALYIRCMLTDGYNGLYTEVLCMFMFSQVCPCCCMWFGTLHIFCIIFDVQCDLLMECM